MKRTVGMILSVALALGTVCALAADKKSSKKADDKDYWSGTGVMVPKKSTFKGQPASKSASLVLQKDRSWEFTAVNAEGKKAVLKGSSAGSVVTETGSKLDLEMKQVDARTVEQEWKSLGKVVWSSRGVVAPNGKTMIMQSKGINQKGDPIEVKAFYKKQK